MPEDNKLKKLAAARKKLKAYQAKEKAGDQTKSEEQDEKSEVRSVIESETSVLASYEVPQVEPVANRADEKHEHEQQLAESFNPFNAPDTAHTSTIELLINEKAALCAELAQIKSESKEKLLAAEEANVRLQNSLKRIERLEKDLIGLQSQNSQLQANVEHFSTVAGQAASDAEKSRQENAELQEYVDELKQALQAQMGKVKMLDDQLKEKECEVELNKIRINQISDVASVETDSKVEVLTQAKFVHEQQIRDLQSMVQQLETEREQASQQYQSYVQHLNKEITAFSEKNVKLNDENMTLVSREQSLIGHIGELEKQLQQQMARQSMQEFVKESHDVARRIAEDEAGDDVKQLQSEKAELLEKQKLLENQIVQMQALIIEKTEQIQEFEEKIENFTSIKSDSSKLLAKVESDKVAASRAVSQNEELKKQLDEVQMKLIQVTNDKVELMDLLDAERHANREIRINFESMKNEIASINEKLHFKDDEMIRLSKENTDLSNRIAELDSGTAKQSIIAENGANNEEHSHSHSCDHSHDEDDHHDNDPHDHNHNDHSGHSHDHHSSHDHTKNIEHTAGSGLPQTEAMRKLEARFKLLMNDIANLTDEKQRLEHLVLQLQGETETIGEYIALYQSQRRVLKQREIEKNTQLHKLKTEREELRDKITLLNQLVNNLSQQCTQKGITNNNDIESNISDNTQSTATFTNNNLTSNDTENLLNKISNNKEIDSNEIISAIKNIVSDIKERERTEIDLNFVPILDHCSCCSGEFETI